MQNDLDQRGEARKYNGLKHHQKGRSTIMPAETNLSTLLKTLNPVLSTEEYVFCTTKEPFEKLIGLNPWAIIQEEESSTIIVTKEKADVTCLEYQGIFKRITLTVNSSLSAVGLTAVVTKKLSENHIAANIIAGYYHDHIFILKENGEKALELLIELEGIKK